MKNITSQKDTSNGILIFINDGQNNDEILNIVKNALNLVSQCMIPQLVK